MRYEIAALKAQSTFGGPWCSGAHYLLAQILLMPLTPPPVQPCRGYVVTRSCHDSSTPPSQNEDHFASYLRHPNSPPGDQVAVLRYHLAASTFLWHFFSGHSCDRANYEAPSAGRFRANQPDSKLGAFIWDVRNRLWLGGYLQSTQSCVNCQTRGRI